MVRRAWRIVCDERGSSLVEQLLALMLLVMVLGVGVEGFAFAQARSVAVAAAQEGVRAAVSDGSAAGLDRAQEVLDAGGGAGRELVPSLAQDAGTVTVTVRGSARSVFPLSILLPSIRASATLPLEQYPADEWAANP